MAIALVTAVGLGLGNFVYQWLTDANWALAMERTWFQTMACLVMALLEHLARRYAGGA